MNNKSHALADNVLNFWLRGNPGSLTAPATVYVALFTASPDKTGGGTEVTGTAYARVPVTFSAPVLGSASNSAPVAFPTVGAGGWGTVVAAALFDAATGGTMLYFGPLAASKTLDAGDTVSYPIGALTAIET